MKTYNFTSLGKTTLVVLLFALFGFYQTASAQLTVVNNLQCWVLVGEEEGANCNFCNVPAGTWIPPIFNAPFNQVTFNQTCTGPVITPFPPPPGQQYWIGIKYGVSGALPGPIIGGASFSDNPFYPGGACGYNQNNSQCGFNAVNPQWVLNTAAGSATVTIQ